MENYKQSEKVYNLIRDYREFYDSLSMHVFNHIPTLTPIIFNYETYIIGSMSKTLKLIESAVREGQINDALSLCRNYYEVVVLHLYLSLKVSEQTTFSRNDKIESWMKGIERFPDFWKNIECLKESNITKDIVMKLNQGEKLKSLKDSLNDHVHFNSFHFLVMNDTSVTYSQRNNYVYKLYLYLIEIFSLHFFTMFTINEHYMRSTDYTDSLDFGEDPDPDSLLWVAPFVQKIVDEHLKSEHIEILDYFKEMSIMLIS